ncbi:MAG: MASE3 domain-containing protein [Promethearchaeota archaeon]
MSELQKYNKIDYVNKFIDNELIEDQSTKRRDIIELAFFSLVLMGTYLTTLYNYLLFHTIAELISIIIGVGIFVIAWNSRKNIDNSFFIVVGIAFLFIGFIDLIHTLAYTGMGIFVEYDSNLPASLWIAARYLQAFSFLYASLMINKKVHPNYLLIGYMIITALLMILIFGRIFPVCYIEGKGLTPFKIISEYIIDLILFITIIIMYKFRKEFNKKVFIFIVSSIISTMIAELAFTFYVSVYGLSNLIGHLFKIIAFFLLYKAIIEIGLENPFNLLFRKLKLSEKMLIDEKIFTETALNSQRDTFFIFDPATSKAIRWNKAFREISGYNDEEISSMMAPMSYYSEEDLKHAAEAIKKIIKDGIALVEMNLITKDRKSIPFEYIGTDINDEKGNLKYIVAIGRDITDRKKAEEKIRYQAHLVDNVSDAIISTDLNLNILTWNTAAEKIYGWKAEEVIRKKVRDTITIEYLNDNEENVLKEFAEKGNWNGEVIQPRKDGEKIYVYSSVSLIKDINGKAIGAVAINRDITKRKKAEQKLEEFVSTVSHELRTPITVLLMSIDYFKNHKDELTKEVEQKLIDGLSRNIASLNDLVEDILTLSKIDEERLKLDWIEFQPLEIINEIIKLMEPRLKAKEIIIEVDISEEIKIFGDKKIIDHIFRILIDNAIKYSNNNSRIEVKGLNNYKHVIDSKQILGLLFQFRDYGIGIKKKDIPHLFERFYRSDNVINISGTGLGLSIARELILLHNGKIFVESEFGKGATFSVFFPKNESKE